MKWILRIREVIEEDFEDSLEGLMIKTPSQSASFYTFECFQSYYRFLGSWLSIPGIGETELLSPSAPPHLVALAPARRLGPTLIQSTMCYWPFA